MKLIYYPDSSLITKTTSTPKFDKHLHKLLNEMQTIMLAHKGVGLAANQVGLTYRMFIFQNEQGLIKEIIGPQILKTDGVISLNEGCLSVPGVFVPLTRPERISVQFFDRFGTSHTELFEGRDCRAVLHEYDHLEGILYLDRLNRKDRKIVFSQLKKKYIAKK
jgi:peptide deformylase